MAEPRSPLRPRPWWLLVAAVFLAVFLVPIPRVLERNLVIAALGDRVHVVLLGLATLVFAYLAARRCGPVRAIVLGVILAMLLGGGIEFLQLLTSRSARWRDFSLDLVGIGIAGCWLVYRRWRSWIALAAGIALALLVPWQLRFIPRLLLAQAVSRQEFPRLADFHDAHAGALWGPSNGAAMQVVNSGDPAHGRVLRAVLPPIPYPGVQMRGFPRDWSGYPRLTGAVRVMQAPTDSVNVMVRLDDDSYHEDHDFAFRRVRTGRQWQRFAIDLPSLRTHHGDRPLELAMMHGLLFYVASPADTVVLQVDDLALTRD